MTDQTERVALQHRAAEALFAKGRPPSAASAALASLTEAEYQKARLFVFTRAYAEQRHSASEHRKRLQEAAGMIPGFFQFRQWCLEDIKAAFHDDRESGTRSAKNRRMAWLHLFKHFARLNKIERVLKIRALDRQGSYLCELTEPQEPDRWGQFVRLARQFGIRGRDLLALAERSSGAELDDEPRERAQA